MVTDFEYRQKLALLLCSKGDDSLDGYAQVVESLGHQVVTASLDTKLVPLIRRLSPDIVIVSRKEEDPAATHKLRRTLPAVKLIAVPSRMRAALPADSSGPSGTSQAGNAAPEKFLYSRKEAAFSLGISLRSLDTLLANKKLATRRMGRKVMIPTGEVKRLARENTYRLAGPS